MIKNKIHHIRGAECIDMIGVTLEGVLALQTLTIDWKLLRDQLGKREIWSGFRIWFAVERTCVRNSHLLLLNAKIRSALFPWWLFPTIYFRTPGNQTILSFGYIPSPIMRLNNLSIGGNLMSFAVMMVRYFFHCRIDNFQIYFLIASTPPLVFCAIAW